MDQQIIYVPVKSLLPPAMAGQTSREAAGTVGAAGVNIISRRKNKRPQPPHAQIELFMQPHTQEIRTFVHSDSGGKTPVIFCWRGRVMVKVLP